MSLVRLEDRLVALDGKGDETGTGFQQPALVQIEKMLSSRRLDAQRPTVRCDPTRGTNSAVALGSVSVPGPAR